LGNVINNTLKNKDLSDIKGTLQHLTAALRAPERTI